MPATFPCPYCRTPVPVPDPAAARAVCPRCGETVAVRRGDTFPGLGSDWLRLAVRDTTTSDAFVAALSDVLRGLYP